MKNIPNNRYLQPQTQSTQILILITFSFHFPPLQGPHLSLQFTPFFLPKNKKKKIERGTEAGRRNIPKEKSIVLGFG